MAFANNQFPVFLKMEQDGTVTAEVRKLEDVLIGSGRRVAEGLRRAGRDADRAFNFDAAIRQITELENRMRSFRNSMSSQRGEPFGIAAGLSGLRTAPLAQSISQQIAAMNALDVARQRASRERVMAVQAEFDTAMRSIRERQAAEARAHREAMANIQEQIAAENALDDQRQRAFAAREQRARDMVAQTRVTGPVTMLNSPAARLQAAAFASRSALSAGGDQAAAARAAQDAVARLNAMQLAATASARNMGAAGVLAGRSSATAFHTAAAAAGVFQGALGGVASRLGFVGSLIDTIGARTAIALGALAGGGAILAAGRQLQNYQALLKSTTTSEAEYGRAQAATARIAAATRSSLGETIRAYARLRVNTLELGISEQQLAGILTTTQQAIQLSGANAQESAAAMQQFVQAIGNSRLSGDEFRSLGENANRVLRVIAEGIRELNLIEGFDGSIGALRELGQAGELTAEVVTRAISHMSSRIEYEFSRMPVTLSQAQTQLANAFAELGLRIERTTGLMQGAASAVSFIANSMGGLTAIVTGVGAAFTVALLPALARAAVAAVANARAFAALTVQFGLFQAASLAGGSAAGLFGRAIAALVTPAGLAAIAIGTVTAAVLYFSQETPRAGRVAEVFAANLEQVRANADNAANSIRNAANEARAFALQRRGDDLNDELQRLRQSRGGIAAGLATYSRMTRQPGYEQAGQRFLDSGGNVDQLERDLRRLRPGGRLDADVRTTLDEYRASVLAVRDHQAALRQALNESRGGSRDGTSWFAEPARQRRGIDQLNAEADAASDAATRLESVARRRRAALAALTAEFGGRQEIARADPARQDEYVERRRQLTQQFDAEAQAIRDGNQARAAGGRATRQQNARDNAEMFAQARTIGEAGDLIAEARARYAEQMVRIRNQLAEGSVTRAAAGTMAADALRARNEAIEAARAAERLGQALERMDQEFDGEPKWIDRIQRARAQLDDARSMLDEFGQVELGDRIFTRDDLDELGRNVETALIQPIEDARREMQTTLDVQRLILAGREDEARFLERSMQILRAYGQLNEADLATVRARLAGLREQIKEEQAINRALQQRENDIQRLSQSARDVQDGLTGILRDPFRGSSWRNLWDNLFEGFKDNFAETLSIRLFGDLGADIEDMLRRQGDPLGASADDLIEAALSHQRAATALETAAGQIGAAVSGAPSLGQMAATPTAFGAAVGAGTGGIAAAPIAAAMAGMGGLFGTRALQISGGLGGLLSPMRRASNDNGVDQEVVITGQRTQTQLLKQQVLQQQRNPLVNNPVKFYNDLGERLGASIGGKNSVLAKVGARLGSALQGAQLGEMSDSLVKALGIRGSRTGGQIGGAIGGAFLGPLGAIGGGILGSIVGGLFKGSQKGTATIGGGAYGGLDIVGTSGKSKYVAAASGAAGSAIEALDRLAAQLGVSLNAAAGRVSITARKDSFWVDPSGAGATKKKRGAIEFKDERDAIEYAMRDLIKDGVLGPIRAGTQRLLMNSRSLEAGIDKALKFESIFTRLKQYLDPVGAAIDAVEMEFTDLRRIAAEAGASVAELAELEQLYGLERAEAIKRAQRDLLGTLQNLLKDITFKADSGLSLRTRQASAFEVFNPLRAQIESGARVDDEAFDEAARALLDITRQIYGSTQDYFDTLELIQALTRRAIVNAGGTPSVSGPIAGLTDGAANDNAMVAPIVDSIHSTNDKLIGKFDELIGAVLGLDRGGLPYDAGPVYGERLHLSREAW